MDITPLVELLRASRAVLAFTGAGISTASGIPDYRGPRGMWKTKEPVYFQDFMHSEAARIEYWEQKLGNWPTIRDASPTATHRAIVELETAGKVLLVLTQNIDGLHEDAGTSRSRLVEIHGSNRKVECMSCHRMSPTDEHFAAFAADRRPPTCSSCGGFLKPATISFGQSLRSSDLARASAAAGSCDLVLALGSSLSVQPAASFPLTAAQRGIPYVIVNRGVTEHDHEPCVTLKLDGDVDDIFPSAVRQALAQLPSP